MYFAGVDLAWAGRNPTGVAVVDSDGALVSVGAVRDDDEILAALHPYVHGDRLVGFDAPLVVNNPTGQRPAETALNRDFRRFEAGTHPCNTGKPEFANGARGGRLAQALSLDMDPRSPAPRRAIEVYPHAGNRRIVPVAADVEIQGQAWPCRRPAEIRAAAAAGRHRATGASPATVTCCPARRLDRTAPDRAGSAPQK